MPWAYREMRNVTRGCPVSCAELVRPFVALKAKAAWLRNIPEY